MADVKVKYLDTTGLTHLWGIIKNNFVRTSDYNEDKKSFATSLDVTAFEDTVAISLKNSDGQIIPLVDGESAATGVMIPLADEDNAGLMSMADKAKVDALETTYATIETIEDNERVTAEALNDLNDRINTIDTTVAAVKTYTMSPVTDGLDANVREAYALMEVSGDGSSVKVGETIKIYKDSSLKGVQLVDQALEFTYILTDGTETVVSVDVSKFLAESEFADGLQVVDGVVSVKVDAASEKDYDDVAFVSVSDAGVKVSGIKAAIEKKFGEITIPDVTATGDTLVDASATDHAVTVKATDALTTAVNNANSAVQSVEVVASTYVSGSVAKDGDNKVTITLTDTVNDKLTEYVRFDEMATLSDTEIDEICVF